MLKRILGILSNMFGALSARARKRAAQRKAIKSGSRAAGFGAKKNGPLQKRKFEEDDSVEPDESGDGLQDEDSGEEEAAENSGEEEFAEEEPESEDEFEGEEGEESEEESGEEQGGGPQQARGQPKKFFAGKQRR